MDPYRRYKKQRSKLAEVGWLFAFWLTVAILWVALIAAVGYWGQTIEALKERQ